MWQKLLQDNINGGGTAINIEDITPNWSGNSHTITKDEEGYLIILGTYQNGVLMNLNGNPLSPIAIGGSGTGVGNVYEYFAEVKENDVFNYSYLIGFTCHRLTIV